MYRKQQQPGQPARGQTGSGYNALIVGRTDGNHSHGPTTINGAGRGAPHIVAPASTTSSATPMVSSSAALLHEKAAGPDAASSETMRAVLMAGATKTEFADWNRTSTRPLDAQFGAGEVNVYNSYQILEGGQFAGQPAEIALDVGEAGWDYVEQIQESVSLYYSFNIDPGFRLDELSISLNWNLEVEDLNPSPNVFDPSTSLANLDLRFFDSSDELLGSLLDTSQSTVDNLEHLYFPRLEAGTYTLEVMALNGSTDYGLAWSSTLSAVPEPTGGMLLGAITTAIVVFRRRTGYHIQA